MRIRIPLSAGQVARQSFRAQCVVIASTGAASAVDFKIAGSDWQDVDSYGQCERLFGIYDPSRTFTGVELTSPVDCVVELIISKSRVEVMDGATVNASIDATQLPLPVRFEGVQPTDRSGTAEAGAPHQIMPANVARKGWFFQCKAAECWLSEQGPATGDHPDIYVPAGAVYEAPQGGASTAAISVYCSSAAKFTAREW